MADAALQWGSDLGFGPGGDIAMVAGPPLGAQLVLRRLLTNLGDYIWQLGYGAGLAQYVGTPADALRIRGAIRSQIFREASVARTPEPVIDVSASPDGSVFVQLRYVDAPSGQNQLLAFPVGD